MAFSFKQKIYAKFFLIIVLAAALVFFGIYPLFKKIKTVSSEIQENKAIFLNFDNQNSYVMRLQKEYNGIEKEIPVISANFLTDDQKVEFLEFLESIADITSSSLKINVLNAGTDLKEEARDKKNKQKFISFQLILENEFNGMMDFLAYLENSDYYIDVDSMNVKAANSKLSGNSGKISEKKNILSEKVTATFKINVYTKE